MELLDALPQDRPSEFCEPHERGQVQFHAAPHIVRAMFPGNGFGKTRAAGTEANWWLTHRGVGRATTAIVSETCRG
jgi:hypothetical protein